MKLRHAILSFLAIALVASGCGSGAGDGDGDGDKKGGDTGSTKAASSKETSAATKDRDVKVKAVDRAKGDFDKNPKDVGACRNLAMAYVAIASPASQTDPKADPNPLPKDRDKNLAKSVDTLEECVDIDEGDRDVQQMLASTYMATNQYDKATPLLERLAKSAKGNERANAYYAWGLAASNAQQYTDAIAAWNQFVSSAEPKDPRIPQVRSSIKALQQAAKNPPPAAAPATGDDSGDESAADPNTDDKGGDDAEDTGSDDK